MLGVLWHVAATDWRNRTRERSFLLTLGLVIFATVYFLPPGNATYSTLTVNGMRGLYTSAYVGAVAGALVACLIGVIGFFTGGTIALDTRTKMAELMGTYPLPRAVYMGGRTLGHMAFLLMLTGVSLASAIGLQWLRAESPVEWLTLGEYYLAFPAALSLAAAGLTALADVVGLAKGVWGSVLFFVLYLTFIGLGTGLAPVGLGYLDPTGIGLIAYRLARSLLDKGLLNIDELDVVVGNPGRPATGVFTWDAPLGPDLARGRLIWVAVGVVATILAAVFYRGYRVRRISGIGRRSAQPATSTRRWQMPLYASAHSQYAGWVWADILAVGAESPWFFGVLLLPVLAGVMPREYALHVVAPLAFLAAIGPLASTATRHRENGAEPLLLTAPKVREKLAIWKLASCGVIALAAVAPVVMVLGARYGGMTALVLPLGAIQAAAIVACLAAFGASSRTTIGTVALLWYLNAFDRAPGVVDWMGLQPSGPHLSVLGVSLTALLVFAVWAHGRVSPALKPT